MFGHPWLISEIFVSAVFCQWDYSNQAFNFSQDLALNLFFPDILVRRKESLTSVLYTKHQFHLFHKWDIVYHIYNLTSVRLLPQ